MEGKLKTRQNQKHPQTEVHRKLLQNASLSTRFCCKYKHLPIGLLSSCAANALLMLASEAGIKNAALAFQHQGGRGVISGLRSAVLPDPEHAK